MDTRGTTRFAEMITKSPEETRRVGRELATRLPTPSLVLLVGELGAGKTTFVQGMGAGLNVKENVTSPAFLLLKEYRGAKTLRHIDLYKINEISEVEKVGLTEDLPDDAIVVVEWGEKVDLNLILPTVVVQFEPEEDENARKLILFSLRLERKEVEELKDALRDY